MSQLQEKILNQEEKQFIEGIGPELGMINHVQNQPSTQQTIVQDNNTALNMGIGDQKNTESN